MEETIYSTTILPSGVTATILQGTGYHFFKASAEQVSRGEGTDQILKHLMILLVKIDGKKISLEQLEEMDIRDVMHLGTVINTMIEPSN